MTRWHLQRRGTDGNDSAPVSIDASNIRLSWMTGKSAAQINELPVGADGRSVRLGDLFELTMDDSPTDRIVVEGELDHVHGLAAMHDRGDFEIIGSAGHYAACGMTGGRVCVRGDAGDYVAAPCGARRSGMSGGVIEIHGGVGNYAGHRMRRGTLMVRGSAGSMLGGSMVAGTICVGGATGNGLAVGMKRGSVILADAANVVRQADQDEDGAKRRYSSPIRFDPAFFGLYHEPMFQEITQMLLRLPVFRTRADRHVGGLGEVIFAATAETAVS
ncbi:Formyltransferase/hydrolase complex Fhc subunit C [Stieleria maiorica]|uniref:Formyltransferase/hydrolase complex Fhc subunit C n=1 Tax=Stieleria maiorica TaxID=2795974 RepID=A0A5B9MN35_9BACT|nr:hypothetical protein [Stieleria maiorica]QEG01810.1 Formyltransferase/hydrolase complex Fhc subunit C [Stieleria maiorica]